MDRRSWLWRRKSSEKSPGETESSGSVSSHSERFSDDQACTTHNPQLTEVTSKAIPTAEEINDNVKTLTEKLSAALLKISAKEDLVEQHAKVAEEAVSGWEKAEKQVLALKQQFEAATKKNSVLEDRVGQLDAALKECTRQLRQGREEQERSINEALARKTREWESMKPQLEAKLIELQAQFELAKGNAHASVDSGLHQKLEASEKENSLLKLELCARVEELEICIVERDMSTQAAETASKQLLESIKKVAKLEAECHHRLKAMARKASPASDHRSLTASSIYVESYADSQSNIGERLLAVEIDAQKMHDLGMNKCDPNCSDLWASSLVTEFDQFNSQKAPGRSLLVTGTELNLMDDFLEMEKLAALPDAESGSSFVEASPISNEANGGESPRKTELEALIHRNADLEKKIEKIEGEKFKSEMGLTECQKQLVMSQSWLKEADAKLVELQAQLSLASELKQAREEELKQIKAKKDDGKSQLRIAEFEIKSLLSKIGSLDTEVQKERALSAEILAKCQKLEDEISNMKCECNLQREAELGHLACFNGELKINQEEEIAVAAHKFAECQKTLSSLGHQLKSLATLEDFLLEAEKSLDLTDEKL